MNPPGAEDRAGAVFGALSDPTRRALLAAISEHPEATATQLASELPRDLIDRRNNETRRVITQEIEDLRGMIREQNEQSDADAFRDRRDAA